MFSAPVIWKRSRRAKRVSLRIDLKQNAVVITLPFGVSKQQGGVLLHSQARWVSQAFESLPPSALERGELLLSGGYRPIVLDQSKTAEIGKDGSFYLGGRKREEKEHYIKEFIYHLADTMLPTYVHHYSDKMFCHPKKITIRDVRSRWGSCTRRGNIMLNARLVMAPSDVAYYVVVHELAHLRYFNHSAEFWEYVDHFCPNGKKGRINSEKWLKSNGILLIRMI